MKSINCQYWSKGRTNTGGLCSLNLYGGRPSYGVCFNHCEHCKTTKEEIECYKIERRVINKLFIDGTGLDTKTALLNYKKHHSESDIKDILLEFAKEGQNKEYLIQVAKKLEIK